jgi:hypothetical protein
MKLIQKMDKKKKIFLSNIVALKAYTFIINSQKINCTTSRQNKFKLKLCFNLRLSINSLFLHSPNLIKNTFGIDYFQEKRAFSAKKSNTPTMENIQNPKLYKVCFSKSSSMHFQDFLRSVNLISLGSCVHN